MKWADSTRRISYRVTAYGPAYDGGFHHEQWNYKLMTDPEFHPIVARNHNAVTAQPFGRATRPQPRTLPWLVALPLFVWLWWGGEL
jgi:hypothetical protein